MPSYKEAKKAGFHCLVRTEEIMLHLNGKQEKTAGDLRREAARCWNGIVTLHRQD